MSAGEIRTDRLTKGSAYPNVTGMTITDLRKELGLTQEAFASQLGLASKSWVSDMERTGKCSVRVALDIERLSDGRIPASSLSPDVGLVRAADKQEDAAA